MEGRFQEIVERREQAPQTPQVPENLPDWEEDPDMWTRSVLENIVGRLEKYEQDIAGRSEQEAQAAQQNEFMSNYQRAAAAFREKQTDFGEAYEHAIAKLTSEAEAKGIYDPQERSRYATNEESRMVSNFVRAGKDPAQAMYEFAKTSGYKAKKADTETDKLEQITKGKAATGVKSSGGAPRDDVTLSNLASLDGEEFDKAFEKLFG